MISQYRCETCKTSCLYNFDRADDDRDFTFDERIRYGNIRLQTRKKGCASHSDFKNQRDMVLDEAIALCERDDIPEFVIIEDVIVILKKLRGDRE